MQKLNAHNETWGGSRHDARGEDLFDVLASLRLVVLTFCRPGVRGSALDFTFISPVSRSRVSWHS